MRRRSKTAHLDTMTNAYPQPGSRPASPGDTVYLAETGKYHFPLHDDLFAPGATEPPVFTVVTVGVMSSVANAEAALDQRIASLRADLVRVEGQFEPGSFRPSGGTGPHGTAASWRRTVWWRDPRTGEEKEGWQQIRLMIVDEDVLP